MMSEKCLPWQYLSHWKSATWFINYKLMNRRVKKNSLHLFADKWGRKLIWAGKNTKHLSSWIQFFVACVWRSILSPYVLRAILPWPTFYYRALLININKNHGTRLMPQMESLHLLRESRARQLALMFLSWMNGNHPRIVKHAKTDRQHNGNQVFRNG